MFKKMIFYLLILISLSLESTDIKQIPLYGSVEANPGSYLYLNIQTFKPQDKVYLELSFSNGYIFNDFYILKTESNDYSAASFGKSFERKSQNVKTSYNFKYTFSYTIPLTRSGNYLLIKIQDFSLAPFTTIKVRHTKSSGLSWFIFGGIGIVVIIICVVIIILWCRRRSSEIMGVIDAPLTPSYQVQPAYVQPTYHQPTYGSPVYVPPAY